MRFVLFILLACCLPARATEYVYTTAVQLQTALTNPAVVAGDIITLRAGTYVAPYTNSQSQNGLAWLVNQSGTTNNPIVLRSYPGEVAMLDRQWFLTTSKHHKFLNLEFYDSQKGTHGGDPQGFIDDSNGTSSGNEWVNCVFHDSDMGLGGFSAGKSVRGCIFYYVGQSLSEHCVYPSVENFSGNISAWTAGSTIQLGIAGINISSNIAFGSGVTIAQSGPEFLLVYGGSFSNNVVFEAGSLGSSALYHNGGALIATGNKLASRTPLVLQGSEAVTALGNESYMNYSGSAYVLRRLTSSAGSWTVNGNSYFSTGTVTFDNTNNTRTFTQWKSDYSAFDTTSTASSSTAPSDAVTVIPNADESKRAHIAVFNWSGADNVTVSLAGVLNAGDGYHLISAQNYSAGAIRTGTYNGTSISVPMTNLTVAAKLYGTNASGTLTSPTFAVFVVKSGAANGIIANATFQTLTTQ